MQHRKKIVITGATGNVGLALLNHFRQHNCNLKIVAAVRDIASDRKKIGGYDLDFTKFDFTDIATYNSALEDCDLLFLLRPPQISQVDKYFKPLIAHAKQAGIGHIVFLSVQGVEKSSLIPHHKIEALIRKSKRPFTFLRPAYFMQNFTTTLHTDLVDKKRIFLPAGRVRFTLVDVRDIGAVAAKVLLNADSHLNCSYDLTGIDKLSFEEMAKELSDGLGTNIQYHSPSLLHFFFAKRRERVPISFILVMMALHYLPRFAKESPVTDWVTKITGRPSGTFKEFINENKALLSLTE